MENMNNNIQTPSITPTVQVKHGLTGKEKAIIIILGHVFIFVLFFATWDIFGKKVFCPVTTTSTQQTTVTTNPQPQTGKDNKGGNATKVDSSLYATCTAQISDEKVYKTCCDNLNADDSVKKACKKVVDDKNQPQSTTTPTTK